MSALPSCVTFAVPNCLDRAESDTFLQASASSILTVTLLPSTRKPEVELFLSSTITGRQVIQAGPLGEYRGRRLFKPVFQNRLRLHKSIGTALFSNPHRPCGVAIRVVPILIPTVGEAGSSMASTIIIRLRFASGISCWTRCKPLPILRWEMTSAGSRRT